MKKSKWLLLLALISATLMCACGNKDVEEAPVPEPAQTVETAKTTSTIDYSCYDVGNCISLETSSNNLVG